MFVQRTKHQVHETSPVLVCLHASWHHDALMGAGFQNRSGCLTHVVRPMRPGYKCEADRKSLAAGITSLRHKTARKRERGGKVDTQFDARQRKTIREIGESLSISNFISQSCVRICLHFRLCLPPPFPRTLMALV